MQPGLVSVGVVGHLVPGRGDLGDRLRAVLTCGVRAHHEHRRGEPVLAEHLQQPGHRGGQEAGPRSHSGSPWVFRYAQRLSRSSETLAVGPITPSPAPGSGAAVVRRGMASTSTPRTTSVIPAAPPLPARRDPVAHHGDAGDEAITTVIASQDATDRRRRPALQRHGQARLPDHAGDQHQPCQRVGTGWRAAGRPATGWRSRRGRTRSGQHGRGHDGVAARRHTREPRVAPAHRTGPHRSPRTGPGPIEGADDPAEQDEPGRHHHQDRDLGRCAPASPGQHPEIVASPTATTIPPARGRAAARRGRRTRTGNRRPGPRNRQVKPVLGQSGEQSESGSRSLVPPVVPPRSARRSPCRRALWRWRARQIQACGAFLVDGSEEYGPTMRRPIRGICNNAP